MTPSGPSYVFDDLVVACKNGTTKVHRDAIEDAREYFNLHTEQRILDFIVSGGLENLLFINSKHWVNNPNPTNIVKVDAYNFRTGGKKGYMAFFRAPTGLWLIKSFKLASDRSYEMEDAMRAAGLLRGERNE